MSGPQKFTDADLTHAWVARWRIPLLANPFPRWNYEVALVVPRGDRADLYGTVWPDESEAEVIGSFIDYRRSYYRDGYAKEMLERQFDVDATTNTVILLKTETGWRYRRASFTSGGVWPYFDDAVEQAKYPPTKAGLVALIRRINDLGCSFAHWADAHPEVWAEAVAKS